MLVEAITKVFHGGRTIKSEAQVKRLGVKLKDFDDQDLELYECLYKLGPVEAPRLIKSVNPRDPNVVSSYELLCDFYHPAAVQVDNYLKSGGFVISKVNGTFIKWLAQ